MNYKILLFLVGMFLISSVSALQTPKFYWNFDDASTNATSIGAIVSAVANGNLTLVSPQGRGYTGIIGQAWKFNSSTAYINISNQAWNVSITDQLSFSIWTYSQNYTYDGNYYMPYMEELGGGNFMVTSNAEKMSCSMVNATNQYYLLNPVPLNYQWNHFALVYNGTDMVSYLNGVKTNSTSFSKAGFDVSNRKFYVGVQNSNPDGILVDELIYYDYALTQSDITYLYNGGLGHLPTSGLITTLISPEDNFKTNVDSIFFNSSITIGLGNYSMKNATLTIWKSSSIFNQTTNIVTSSPVGGIINYSSWNISGFTNGDYVWNVYACAENSTAILCSSGTNRTITFGFVENSVSYNSTTYETALETFILNSTVASSLTATFYYDGTNYGTSTSTTSGGNTYYSSTINIPVSTGTKSFNWALTDGAGFNINSTTKTQTVNAANFSICDGTYTVKYLNISFKNETLAQSSVSASVASTFNYSLGGSIQKSYSFQNLTGTNPNYLFCFSPANRPVNVDITSFLYYNAESPQREYTASLTLTNGTTNKTLFLLPESLGIYVSFVVINPAQQVIPGATITVSSTSAGVVESKITDTAGSATFFLNPLIAYTITTSKTGYADNSVIITPTQSQYTITLGASAGINTELMKGITFTIEPKIGTTLYNDTAYDFSFTINSTFWALDYFGFTLTNGSDIIGSAYSTSSTGGIVNDNVNVGKNKTIHMNYYWSVNGTVFNASTQSFAIWLPMDTQYQPWGIWNFKNDLATYLDSGIFGLSTGDTMSIGIIVYLAIFLVAGVAAYRYGFTSPAAIMIFVFGAVALADVGMGLIGPTNCSAFDFTCYVPTKATLLILLGVAFWEWTR